MMKKLGFILSFVSVGFLQAMDSTNYSSVSGQDYVIKVTGLGANAMTEVIHDPLMADMMRQMRIAEAACYAREGQERKDKVAVEAAKNEKSFGNGFKKGFFNKESKK